MAATDYLFIVLVLHCFRIDLGGANRATGEVNRKGPAFVDREMLIGDFCESGSFLVRKLLATRSPTTAAAAGVPEEGPQSLLDKIREFYADKNNMAMFVVLPLLVLVYGGCSVVYCIAKCRRHIRRKRRQPHGEKQQQQQRDPDLEASEEDADFSDTVLRDGSGSRQKPTGPRPPSGRGNRVFPAPAASDRRQTPNPRKTDDSARDLLTDYDFFASWVMAKKAAEILQLTTFPDGQRSDTDTSKQSKRLIFIA